jgi:hypothetical protein
MSALEQRLEFDHEHSSDREWDEELDGADPPL